MIDHPIADFTKAWIRKGDRTALTNLTEGLYQTAGMQWEEAGPGKKTHHGEAIDPARAAHCTIGQEQGRTGAFIKALYAAVLEKKLQHPHRPIRVAELGSGPLAPISLSVASQFRPEDIQVTAVDIFERSIGKVNKLVNALKLQDHVENTFAGDLLTDSWAHLNPDIVVLEVMMPGLIDEPQGAAAATLAPQFSEDTIWIPETILVSGELFHGYNCPPNKRIKLGEICHIGDDFRSRARGGHPRIDLISVNKTFQLPHPAPTSFHLGVHTEVQLRGPHKVTSPSRIVQTEVSACMGRVNEGDTQVHIHYKMGDQTINYNSSRRTE